MTKVNALCNVAPTVSAILTGKTSRLRLLLALLFLPVCFLLIYLVNFRDNTLHILPSDEFFSKGRWAYANPESTTHHYKSNPDVVSIDYTLGGSIIYAGIGFNLSYDFPFFDLSNYDTLKLKIFTGRAKSLFVAVRTYEPGISDAKRGFEPARHLEAVIPLHSPQGVYEIPLSSLKDPQWWISQNGAQKIKLEQHPLKYALALQIFISDHGLVGQRDAMIIRQVAFHALPPLPEAAVWGLTGFYYIMLVFFIVRDILKRRNTESKQNIISSYKKLDLSSYKDQDTEKINLFIKEHYFEPDVSVEKLIQATGLSQKRIADILHKEYKMNFKEFINWLRLEEAKRLLRETDINIIEIAFRLGYNSNSYFGSIFKKTAGVSPKEYREKHALEN